MKNGSNNELGGKHFNAINDALGVMPLVRLVWLQAGRGDNIYMISELLRIGPRNVPLHRKSKEYESGYFLGCGVRSGNQGYQRPDMTAQILVSVLPRFAKRYPSTTSFDGLN